MPVAPAARAAGPTPKGDLSRAPRRAMMARSVSPVRKAPSSGMAKAPPASAGEARLHDLVSLRRFELIANETRDIVMFIRREDGRIIEANAAALAAYGYDRAALLALSIQDLRAPGTHALTEEQLAAAEAIGILFETVHRRKDGSTFPVEVSSRGAVVGGASMLISVVRDITDRKRAEDALRRSQAELQATVEGLAEGVITSTVDGQLVHWNRAALEMHGFSSDDELRRRLADFASIYTLATPEGRELTFEEWPLSRLLRGEAVRDLELVLARRADGWVRVFSYGGALVRSSDGRPMAILTVVDVTERRRALAQLAAERDRLVVAEQALRTSEARLRLLAEGLPQLVWAADASGRLDYFNQRWRDYTGQRAGEEGWDPALHPEDRERVGALWRAALAEQREFESEHRLRGADGGFRWFLRRAFPLRDLDGTTRRWFGTCTDIHDLKVSHERLRQADRLKEDFLAMASHEFRTPLTALRLQADLLREGLRKLHGPQERTDRQLRVIDRQVERLEKLVGVLFDASRIAEGKLQLELADTDLAEVARDAVERLATEAAQAGVEIRLELQPVIGRWDRLRLEQVVTNLLGNAVKYGSHRPVDVSVGRRDGRAVLVVRDHGIGIPPESHALIFERYQRASNVAPVKGLGLGLWIARSMVAAHGGELRVESAPGEGATFTVSLPLR
jgi:PAS domain S-box-containing protein